MSSYFDEKRRQIQAVSSQHDLWELEREVRRDMILCCGVCLDEEQARQVYSVLLKHSWIFWTETVLRGPSVPAVSIQEPDYETWQEGRKFFLNGMSDLHDIFHGFAYADAPCGDNPRAAWSVLAEKAGQTIINTWGVK